MPAPCHALRLDVPSARLLAMRDATVGYRYRDGVPASRAEDGT